jgi:glycosyltransferase involved in cell wall biosynthesis
LSNVIFTGFVPNERIPLYQSAADVLLMPYQRSVATSSGGNTAEICSPMKMFEYMAAGRAILSSDLPVLHEVLENSMAVFCPLDDEEAWEEGLRKLLADPERRQMLGRTARGAVLQYSWIERAKRILLGYAE